MRYALYPGCTVLGRGRNYELAAREIAAICGIELVDLEGFECCGYPLKSLHRDTYVQMAARNILLAESQGMNICTLCSACTSSLTEVNRDLAMDFEDKARIIAQFRKQNIPARMGRPIRVKHFTRILYEDVGVDEIRRLVTKPLNGLTFAPHYGCHYLKPSEIYGGIEDPENPHSLDELIAVTGARSIDYQEKLKCCGAGVLAVSQDVAYSMARPKLQELKQLAVDAMVLMCPFCSVMYDDNQKKIEQRFAEQYSIPVLYYPQLLGLALSLDNKKLGLRMNRVSTKNLLEKIAGLRIEE
jgi:heterodisulfide reductase subunit B